MLVIFLKKLDVRLAQFLRYSVVVLSLLLAALMFTAVILRYVLSASFPEVEELSVLVGLWLYFFAMIIVTRERSHLHGGIADLLNMSDKLRAGIQYMNYLIAFALTSAFAFYTVKYLLFTMKINRTSTSLQWPTAIWVSAAVFGFLLMAMYLSRELFSFRFKVGDYDYKSPHPSKDKPLGEL
ncbi:TRAP transporter small permease [Aliamphritea hakodatensis]|uniref:TRAP transporter small permease n=1 Tax=Aliamphritea hakodatensis TaxID=2895352 RepID=UPI0022FD6610|nr:TRAP transporter small permease [Aliamphritea hakodatensis]